jgi:TolB-like protein/class 3 adenylate cyclase
MAEAPPGRVGRRLAAIVAADVAGYSRLMGLDEVGTARILREHRAVTDALVARHGGRIVKTTGDGVLLEFPSVVDAVECAMAVQAVMAERNEGVPQDRRMLFRIGINLGDILIDGDDILGDGVNLAARLEGIAEPGGICISSSAHEQVRGKVAVEFADLGEQRLKNIQRPVRAYAAYSQGHLGASDGQTASSHPETQNKLPLPDKPSIAVLPFQNMSGDPDQEYFADGMVEDIITALSRFKSLFVIARNSSFAYKGKAVDIKQVGRELGVRYILEGSVRKAGGKVRITGQLIEASTGAHLWANRFDAPVENVFELQDDVTTSVIGAIAPRLIDAEMEVARRKRPNDLDSYDHYLRGLWHLYEFTPVSLDRSRQEARRAIELDGKFGSAYSLAAFSLYARKFNLGHELSDAEAKEAIELIRTALELAHDDDFVLTRASMILSNMADEFERGLALANRAIALNPNLAGAHNARGWSSLFLGKFDDAVEAFAAGLRLNPLDRWNLRSALRGLASAYSMSRRYGEGLKWAEQCLLEVDPKDLLALLIVCDAKLRLGQIGEARDVADKVRVLHPHLTIGLLRGAYRHFRRPKDLVRVDEVFNSLELPE